MTGGERNIDAAGENGEGGGMGNRKNRTSERKGGWKSAAFSDM